MHSAKFLAVLAAGALAVPFEKRDAVVQTTVDIVYVTDVVTVTQGGNNAAPTPQGQSWNSQSNGGWGWGSWGSWGNGAQPTHEPQPKQSSQTWSPPPQPTKYSNGNGGNKGNGGHHSSKQQPQPSKQSSHSAPSQTQSSPEPSGSSYIDHCMISHNLHRKNHTVADLTWSDNLAASAKIIADSCVYAHNVGVNGGGYGQNIAAGVRGDNISEIITGLFYNGEVNNYAGYYGEAQPPMTNFDGWGHFSQIVWKNTASVGCYTADCSGQGLANTGGDVEPFFTVCNYEPAGNYANEYGANVLKPLGEPTAQWNTGFN